MTRLIDADSIPWDVEGVGEIPVITKEEIDEMPTVDAVPLKWIIRRIEGLNIQAENSTDGNKWAEFVREAFALEKIVKFWAERKEE